LNAVTIAVRDDLTVRQLVRMGALLLDAEKATKTAYDATWLGDDSSFVAYHTRADVRDGIRAALTDVLRSFHGDDGVPHWYADCVVGRRVTVRFQSGIVSVSEAFPS
jgi:hypothetical protein